MLEKFIDDLNESMDWWKSPVLQGEENDYGDYDYLIEELPQNTKGWELFYQKCDTCGKYHRLNYCMTNWFRTMDGGDSFDYTDCWKCILKSKICSHKLKIKRNFENIRQRFFAWMMEHHRKIFNVLNKAFPNFTLPF